MSRSEERRKRAAPTPGPSPAGRGAVLIAALLLAGCGKLGPLQPVSPDRAPPRPLNALVPPTPEEQLVVPPQAAPLRADDPIKKSRERADDRFDLPPPGL